MTWTYNITEGVGIILIKDHMPYSQRHSNASVSVTANAILSAQFIYDIAFGIIQSDSHLSVQEKLQFIKVVSNASNDLVKLGNMV